MKLILKLISIIILFGVWWKAINNERPLVAAIALVLITAILMSIVFGVWIDEVAPWFRLPGA